jgi:glycosyltransferase involved in cell wall biosynthesis
MITVFTPTYNRAALLPRLYESLCAQSHRDFEWVIVDDGSVDKSEEIIKEWVAAGLLTIRYFKQKNGGKHRAINQGLRMAIGELFFIVDSDDFLPKNALSNVIKQFSTVSGDTTVAGVAGRRMYDTGAIVGNSTFTKVLSNSIKIRYEHRVTGDLVEVFRTAVLKQFLFPEFPNEKFCPEALVWNRIAQQYKLLFFNEGIYVTEYLVGGLTSNIVRIRMQSPLSSMLCYSELSHCDIPILQKMKAVINFWRFSFNTTELSLFQKFSKVNFGLSSVGFFLGFALFLKDKNKTNNTK